MTTRTSLRRAITAAIHADLCDGSNDHHHAECEQMGQRYADAAIDSLQADGAQESSPELLSRSVEDQTLLDELSLHAAMSNIEHLREAANAGRLRRREYIMSLGEIAESAMQVWRAALREWAEHLGEESDDGG